MRRGFSRRRRAPDLWIPGFVLTFIVLACFVWPCVGGVPAPVGAHVSDANLPVGSPGHLLGTDPIGNDELSRLLYGGRTAIAIGIAANALGLLIGGAVGIVAAYLGGATDYLVSRALDVLIAFPSLILALVVAAWLGPGAVQVIGALSFFTVPSYARLARAQTLRVRALDFVTAARLSGAARHQILARHIAPNVAPHLLTFACLGVSIAIMFEASLSFLGLGISPPAPSWGDMILQGQEYLALRPALVGIPSAVLFVTVLATNLLGDAIRVRFGVRP